MRTGEGTPNQGYPHSKTLKKIHRVHITDTWISSLVVAYFHVAQNLALDVDVSLPPLLFSS